MPREYLAWPDESLAMCARVPKWNVTVDHLTVNRQCRLVMSG